MREGTDEIYVISEGELLSIPHRPMRAGLFGRSLEDALQTLLQDYPGIIPGAQIDPSSDDPPRFALLRREMPVGGWSLDHLYVDQFGILTLIETKLLENPQSRRDVIGQIIEYAANAGVSWAGGNARQHATHFWNKEGKDIDDVLRDAFPDLDIQELWRTVESNLEQGRLRLIIAADSIRPEVRRMIEFLNSEMTNAEVLGLELRVYGEEDGQIILAPRIVGQTQALADRKGPSAGETNWDSRRLREVFEEMPEDESRPLTAILDWAVEKDRFIESRAQSPVFGLVGKSGDRIIGVSSTGVLYLFFEEQRYPQGSQERDRLVDELKELDLIAQEIDPEEVVSGRNFVRSLQELEEAEFQKLFGILRSYCEPPSGSA